MVKQYTYLLLLIFCAAAAKAQQKTIASFDFYYGYKLYYNSFDGQLNSLKSFDTGLPVQQPGIGLTAPVTYSRYDKGNGVADMHLVVNMPQTIYTYDSLRLRLSGFCYSVLLGGTDLVPKSKYIDVDFGSGFDMGQLYLGGSSTKLRNPFFAPALYLKPKFKIGRLSIAAMASYCLDISGSKWKQTWFGPGHQPEIHRLKQTGLSVFVTVGLSLPTMM